MRTYLDCIPCFVRQTLDAARLLSVSEETADRVLRRVLETLVGIRRDASPPAMGRVIHRIIREETGSVDPYAEIKRRSTWIALGLEEEARRRIAAAPDPFEAAVRFAIAGNVMDYAIASLWNEERIRDCFRDALSRSLQDESLEALRTALDGAASVLYLGDNAGETVFDRLLIEQMPEGIVTYVVKGAPILNDATRADAEEAGLDRVAHIVDNGSDAPGTILDLCSPEFVKLFDDAEVVLAKGQANYETLCDVTRPVFFLTQIKCSVIARDVGREVGDWVVTANRAASGPKQQRQSPPETAEPSPETMPHEWISYTPIGYVRSPHTDPQATPIQPCYAEGCDGRIELLPEYAPGLQDLEGFSHIVVLFHFHRAGPQRLVVKPFLQDVERGVFGTRAPCRPNPIGLSVLELKGVEGNVLHVSGVDMLDGTPVLDIKPYVGRFDKITTTRNGWQDSVDEETAERRGRREELGDGGPLS